MSLPSLDSQTPIVARHRHRRIPAVWSCTASTEPHDDDKVLVIYRLPLSRLGIEDLSAEVAARCGRAEAVRWQRARVREHVTNLREQLRLHLTAAEFIVHAEEGAAQARLQVIATVPSGDAHETARLEREVADRVEAIAQRAWTTWYEGLCLSIATLRERDGEPLVSGVIPPARIRSSTAGRARRLPVG